MDGPDHKRIRIESGGELPSESTDGNPIVPKVYLTDSSTVGHEGNSEETM